MNIINFSIIAHIDHGKSTLANKIIELTKSEEQQQEGVDNMELEKERGITIKSKAIRLNYTEDKKQYQLNMIDTPGHVDFSYEVSKALMTCDFAFLLVDSTKGVQAQTVSNAYKALEKEIEIIPVINKIDMQNAQIKETLEELKNSFGFLESEVLNISAKTGEGVDKLLEELIKRGTKKIEDRKKEENGQNNMRALIFDSFYDEYMGVTLLVLVEGGSIKSGDSLYLNSNNQKFKIQNLGYYNPSKKEVDYLNSHEVGFIVTGFKDLELVNIGDTLFKEGTSSKPFPGFEIIKPLVYLGVFPESSEDTQDLRKALDVLHLTDSSFTYTPESAGNLGHGFNCGFLGLLHADIILERIKREFDLKVIVTSPSVSYIIKEKNSEEYEISSAREYPDPTKIDYIKEPYVELNIVCPEKYIGSIVKLCLENRGELQDTKYSSSLGSKQVHVKVKIPLSEVVIDFNNKLKSITSGYASYDYEVLGYEKSDIVKLDIYIADELFFPLSNLVHKSRAESIGRETILKLKEELPREQFSISLQAAIGGKIIAREDIREYRKDVTAKLYGGDQTRKTKLLDKQKRGKKKMKKLGQVSVDKETFLKVIKRN